MSQSWRAPKLTSHKQKRTKIIAVVAAVALIVVCALVAVVVRVISNEPPDTSAIDITLDELSAADYTRVSGPVELEGGSAELEATLRSDGTLAGALTTGSGTIDVVDTGGDVYVSTSGRTWGVLGVVGGEGRIWANAERGLVLPERMALASDDISESLARAEWEDTSGEGVRSYSDGTQISSIEQGVEFANSAGQTFTVRRATSNSIEQFNQLIAKATDADKVLQPTDAGPLTIADAPPAEKKDPEPVPRPGPEFTGGGPAEEGHTAQGGSAPVAPDLSKDNEVPEPGQP